MTMLLHDGGLIQHVNQTNRTCEITLRPEASCGLP